MKSISLINDNHSDDYLINDNYSDDYSENHSEMILLIISICQALKDWEERLRAAIKEGQEGSLAILSSKD